MPIRDRIVWGPRNPFSDPRLADFPALIRDFKRGNNRGWRADTFRNDEGFLPKKPHGHYREHYVGNKNVSGSLRIILGQDGEIFVSGNHYGDFRQIIGVPFI